jgi:hypothetical protein
MSARINTRLHDVCVSLLLAQSEYDAALNKAHEAGVHLEKGMHVELLPFVNTALGLPADDDAIFNMFYDVDVVDWPFFGTERAEEMVTRLCLLVGDQKQTEAVQ